MLKLITVSQRSAILISGILLITAIILSLSLVSLDKVFAQQLNPSDTGPRIDTYIIQNGVDKSFIDLGDVVAGSIFTFTIKACRQNYQFPTGSRGVFAPKGGGPTASTLANGYVGSTHFGIDPFYIPISAGATCFQSPMQLITSSDDSGHYSYSIYGCIVNSLGISIGNRYPCGQNLFSLFFPPIYNPYQVNLRFRLVSPPIPPTLTFSAGQTSVTSGNSFNLNWSSTNTTSIDTSRSPTSCPDAGVLTPVASGSKSLTAPIVTTDTTCTYTATASGPGGVTSKTVSVIVTSPVVLAPTLLGIVPNSGIVGSVVPVTLTGTNFAAGATINAGAGITVSNVVVGSPTQITATFAIAATATVGDRNVTVTVSGFTSNSKIFTVNPLGGGDTGGGGTGGGGGGSGGGGAFPTSCGLLVCFSYDPKVIILPPPGFTRIIKPFIAEVAP